MADNNKIAELVCETISSDCAKHCYLSDGSYCTECSNIANHLVENGVVVVKRGHWKQNPYCKRIYFCSECGRHIEDGSNNPLEHFPYCHCGAKMEG